MLTRPLSADSCRHALHFPALTLPRLSFLLTAVETHRALGCLLVPTSAAAAAAPLEPLGACWRRPPRVPAAPAPSTPSLTSRPPVLLAPHTGTASSSVRAMPSSRPPRRGPFVLPAPCPLLPAALCCLRLPPSCGPFHSLHLHGGGLIFSFHCFHGDLTCAIVPEAASRHVPVSNGVSRDLPSSSPWQSHACSGAGALVTSCGTWLLTPSVPP